MCFLYCGLQHKQTAGADRDSLLSRRGIKGLGKIETRTMWNGTLQGTDEAWHVVERPKTLSWELEGTDLAKGHFVTAG